jgi:glycosyltransferase involved in cell wall biosynthesis
VLWVHADTGARSTAPLADRRVSDHCAAIAFVSEWQRQQYVLKFKLPLDRTWILRNAVAFAFEGMFTGARSVLAAKSSPPELIYASMPYRGLAWLIDCWPEIRRRVPAACLKVISSNSTYQTADDEDTLRLIARCRETEGVDYHPAVRQPILAQLMQGAAILAYPTNFAETHCITALQAMASGALVVSSDYGALAEMTCGFGRLVPDVSSKESFLSRYVTTVCAALEEFEAMDARLDESLVQQVAFINSRFSYRKRAQELVEWLARLA